MPGVSKSEITAAKQIPAITYLKQYRPGELVRCGRGEFELKSHDSFKINEESSVWHWKSRDIGGRSALDYLIYVEGHSFVDAVRSLNADAVSSSCVTPQPREPTSLPRQERAFVLPESAPDTRRVEAYLIGRGISRETIQYCVERGILYESKSYHNAVFVGLNAEGIPRYAALRGTNDLRGVFKIEQTGSNKRYCFCIPPDRLNVTTVAVFEAAPDALAHMTLCESAADCYRLSLGGIYAPSDPAQLKSRPFRQPPALGEFLRQHPEVDTMRLCLDNDHAGRWASEELARQYGERYHVLDEPPGIEGGDYADLAKQKMQKAHREQTMRRPQAER